MQTITVIALTTGQRNKIQRAVNALEAVRQEISEQNAGHYINWYLEDSDNLNLMDGDSHDERSNPQREMVIAHFDLPRSGGGGW